jgi:hypothetical protein
VDSRTLHRDLILSPLRPFVRRHRFSTFVGLTFVLTWLPWPTVAWVVRTGRPPAVTTLVLLGGFGPFLAALLVAAAGGDRRSWLRSPSTVAHRERSGGLGGLPRPW